MPLFIVLVMLFFAIVQKEFSFFFNFFDFNNFYCSFLSFNDFTLNNLSAFRSDFQEATEFQVLSNVKLEYNYNYRTYFTQTYLHAAYNKHIKPYKNLLNVDRLFGDYNSRTFGKSSKHARATKHTKLFMLLYSHSLECFAFDRGAVNSPLVMFYFKKHHVYSALEMIYASIYLGMIYFLSFTYTRMVEDSALGLRETEEIDEEDAQNRWYYYREDRRGVFEPSIEDNIELDFAYPQHPVEWDDNGHFYRWEMHFFIFLFSFLICWGVSQSAASMFYYDNFIDLHFIGWFTTFIFIFIFWRIFFLIQFFSFFNRFNIRRNFQFRVFLPIFSNFFLFLIKSLTFYLWPFFSLFLFKIIRIKKFEFQGGLNSTLVLTYLSKLQNLKDSLVGFYRFLYSSFQKNLSSFEKRNNYDFFLSSNLILLYNSNLNFDKIFFFFKKDRIFSNIYSIVRSSVDNYGFLNGLYFPKNMYLTNNKISFPFYNVLPVLFPPYLDFFNVSDLPIWGADLFFNQTQNVFGISGAYENWFFSNQYDKHFDKASNLSNKIKLKSKLYF